MLIALLNIMKSEKISLIVLCFLITASSLDLENQCPPPEMIYPCTCDDSHIYGMDVLCVIVNDNQIRRASKHLSQHNIQRFIIEYGKIYNGTFADIYAKKIEIRNSEIEYFYLFSSLHGMQDRLISLTFFGVTIKNLIFSSGKEFHALEKFQLYNCSNKWDLSFLITSVLPSHLGYIQIGLCDLRLRKNISFQRFQNLHELTLNHNLLTSVNRNFIPRPASNLSFYHLSYNPISFLPDDAFVEMPALKSIWLQDTALTTLSHRVFIPVLNQLTSLKIGGIPLICDCEIMWLLGRMQIWQTDVVKCKYPSLLSGKELSVSNLLHLFGDCEETPTRDRYTNNKHEGENDENIFDISVKEEEVNSNVHTSPGSSFTTYKSNVTESSPSPISEETFNSDEPNGTHDNTSAMGENSTNLTDYVTEQVSSVTNFSQIFQEYLQIIYKYILTNFT